jgi:hypothetical protein
MASGRRQPKPLPPHVSEAQQESGFSGQQPGDLVALTFCSQPVQDFKRFLEPSLPLLLLALLQQPGPIAGAG